MLGKDRRSLWSSESPLTSRLYFTWHCLCSSYSLEVGDWRAVCYILPLRVLRTALSSWVSLLLQGAWWWCSCWERILQRASRSLLEMSSQRRSQILLFTTWQQRTWKSILQSEPSLPEVISITLQTASLLQIYAGNPTRNRARIANDATLCSFGRKLALALKRYLWRIC